MIIETEETRLKSLTKKKKAFFYSTSKVNCTGTENELSLCSLQKTTACKKSNQPVYLRCAPPQIHQTGMDIKKVYQNIHAQNKGFSRRISHERIEALYNIGIAGNSTFLNDPTQNSEKEIHKIRFRTRAGPNVASGRLEVLLRGRWGTVCDRNWSIQSANVACRAMGYGSAQATTTRSTFGPGHLPMWLSDVQCLGHEKSLFDCDYKNISSRHSIPDDYAWAIPKEECNHDREIGVQCHVPDFKPEKNLRIVGGETNLEGRVEVKVDRQWGAICSDGWSILETTVVCRQLGLGYAKTALFDAYFFQTSEKLKNKIVMSEVKCHGNEVSLQECKFKKPSTDRATMTCMKNVNDLFHVAGIICQDTAPDLITDAPMVHRTIHITHTPNYRLKCAQEERCLAASADEVDWVAGYGQRTLLRFSTRTWNRGTTAFQPALHPDEWEWHECHRHYHSMNHFIDYDIMDKNGKRVATGLKASFCLEDVDCYGSAKRNYVCTRGRSAQGISVGCADVYRYNLDCQWIDITDVKPGEYILRLDTNPAHFVAEANYFNNDIVCNLHYTGVTAVVTNCQ